MDTKSAAEYLGLTMSALRTDVARKRVATLVVGAIDTGFRASEMFSIRWRDVDFEKGEISVASCYTKNGEPRRNPMTRRLTEMLTILKGNGSPPPDALVFPPYRYHKAFYTARNAVGLGKDVVFHTLRHTYISRLVSAGVSLRTVQELAGHKEIKMTMRYVHLATEQKRQAVDKLEREVPSEITTMKEGVFVSHCAPVAQLDRASDF